MTDYPERRFVFAAKLGADTYEDLLSLLHTTLINLERDPELREGASGGPSSGGWFLIAEKPHQTHKKYFQEIEEWRKQRKGQ